MKTKYEPHKKHKLSEAHQRIISKASKYQLQILEYLKERELLFVPEKYYDEDAKAFLGERKAIIEVAKHILDTDRYQWFYVRVKVNPNKTKSAPSQYTMRKRKLKSQKSREDKVFSIPNMGVKLNKTEISFYRDLYAKNIGSGMSKEKATEITTERLRNLLANKNKL